MENSLKQIVKQTIRPAIVLFILLSLITGIAYPLITTGIGQWLLADQANGSIITKGGKMIGSSSIIGSTLIGQNFTEPQYFWGRPSATAPYPYNAAASSGSNLGSLNPALSAAVKERVAALKSADPDNRLPVPVDLVTASASGLDPEISPAAAIYQLNRVAKARGLTADKLQALIAENTKGRQWGVFGEPRVNVLMVNVALDEIKH